MLKAKGWIKVLNLVEGLSHDTLPSRAARQMLWVLAKHADARGITFVGVRVVCRGMGYRLTPDGKPTETARVRYRETRAKLLASNLVATVPCDCPRKHRCHYEIDVERLAQHQAPLFARTEKRTDSSEKRTEKRTVNSEKRTEKRTPYNNSTSEQQEIEQLADSVPPAGGTDEHPGEVRCGLLGDESSEPARLLRELAERGIHLDVTHQGTVLNVAQGRLLTDDDKARIQRLKPQLIAALLSPPAPVAADDFVYELDADGNEIPF